MKRLSIKMRVTLWYTLLMIIIVGIILVFMLSISDDFIEKDANATLISVVEENSSEVEYDDGELEIDDDFKFREKYVVSIVMDEAGNLIAGDYHIEQALQTELLEDDVQKIQIDNTMYYLYDQKIVLENGENVWVRGILPDQGAEDVIVFAVRAVMIALPFLVLIAVLGGYLIIKHSFHPIEDMTKMAEEINEGKDLSKRIHIDAGNDEVHKLAETFNRMIQRLETSFESEKQFVANASHELRTPTTVILAQCEYMLENGVSGEEEKESFTVIERQAHKMSRLISQFLLFTRLEQGQEIIKKEKTDMSELIRIVCEEQERLYAQDNISLELQIEENVQAYVNGEMMMRLFINLLTNAYKYSEENGHIIIKLKKNNKEIVLSVEDNGIGIAKDEQEKIWQRFYQTNTAIMGKENGGIGLGLAMVSDIAKLHGGRMQVDSQFGKGSIFTFFLPI